MHFFNLTPMLPRPVTRCRLVRRRGFTLVELLTVIAIIGILAAIVIPVVGKARKSARTTQSIANLRSIAQGVLLFTGENRRILPQLVDLNETGGFGQRHWSRVIEPYIAPASVGGWTDLYNRTYRQSPTLVSPLLENGQHHSIGDYGANRDVLTHPNSAPRPLVEITRPSRTVMVAAAETRGFDRLVGAWFFETMAYIANPAGATAAPSDHGTGRIAAAFVDGHVEQIPIPDFEANRREYLLVNP